MQRLNTIHRQSSHGCSGTRSRNLGHSALVLCLPLPPNQNSCVTLAKLLDISEPPIVICETERTAVTRADPTGHVESVGFIGGGHAMSAQPPEELETDVSHRAVSCVYTANPYLKPWTPDFGSLHGGQNSVPSA